MSGEGKLDELFFELASENRLTILQQLRGGSLRMQAIARRLEVTPTEAFRQLERLSAASLVQRQPDGTFALTEYGRLVLQTSRSLEFVSKHRDYFSTHALTRLPAQFLGRLSELSHAEFEADTIRALNRGAEAFTRAKLYIWGLGEGTIPEHMVPVMAEQVQRGIEVRMLLARRPSPADRREPGGPRNVETRRISECPALIALTEKDAVVAFCQVGGKMDYAVFFGDDPVFHDWVRDLFLYYWQKGKRTE